jgi:hypothetical protein
VVRHLANAALLGKAQAKVLLLSPFGDFVGGDDRQRQEQEEGCGAHKKKRGRKRITKTCRALLALLNA